MKSTSLFIIVVLLILSYQATASPPFAPFLFKPDINGTSVTIVWMPDPGRATKYRLNYAPIPYTGPDSIRSLDIEGATNSNFRVDLWEGASFYVAVQAGNADGFSEYSNIQSITVFSPGSINLSGNWSVTEKFSLNNCPRNEINGIAVIMQLYDSVTITLPTGDSFSGSIVDNELNMLGSFKGEGDRKIPATIAFTIEGNNEFSGFASGGDGACNSVSSFSFSR